ncbi:ABC transporter permease [Virgisporangium ochraceum]|uniref:Transport permease protein n=1 Tax=Virgisporangium ochraceum TaxID=65505 RepID=A0A8J3ZXY6_9ACTN|nr:ABC transporter permease [Virgisporangium ochraceum]GIJ71686.1 transport permease protein [Virgisporangium ochraceum]
MIRAVRSVSWIELKLFLREPVTVIFTLALPPLVLFVLAQVFGNTPDPSVYEGVGPITFYTPAYIALVVASLGLIGLPVHLASYRERGVLRRLRAARLPVRVLLASQLFVMLVGAVAGAVVLLAMARVRYDVTWPESWAGVGFALVLGVVAFGALGVLIGVAVRTARAAQGIGVLLWFLMMMVSGSGPPPEVLGGALRGIATALPLRHLVVAVQDPWLGRGVNWAETAVLLAIVAVAGGLAVPALRQRA